MKASISRINCFKACRRMYFLKYVEGIVPVSTPEALETGRNYHARIEALYTGEEIANDYSKDAAMAEAYKRFIMPKVRIVKPEIALTKQIGNHVLEGIVDGVADDGNIVEHKSTSADLKSGEFEYNLQWDEQVPAYMSLTGARMCHYTACQKPTIRQKQNETDEEFYQRMIDWYDESKIVTFDVYRTDEEIKAFEEDFVRICDEMERAEYMYRNTRQCMAYGRRCEYAGICLNYDPNEDYVDFIKKER